MTPATLTNEKRYSGIKISILGVEFGLVFDPRGASLEQLDAEGWKFRPTDLAFEQERRRPHWMKLTWPPGTGTNAMRITAENYRPEP